jgi:hypothetical protein
VETPIFSKACDYKDPVEAFLVPENSTHRQDEALRAYFVERLPAPQVAARFGYTVGSFRQLVHQFRRSPQRRFFAEPPPRGVKASDAIRDQIIRLRKQNLSVYDISEALKKGKAPRQNKLTIVFAAGEGRSSSSRHEKNRA